MCLMYQTLILSGLSGVLFFSFLFWFVSFWVPFPFSAFCLPSWVPPFPPSSPLVPVLGPFPSSVLFFLFSSLSFPFPFSSLGCFFFPSFLLPFLFPPSFPFLPFLPSFLFPSFSLFPLSLFSFCLLFCFPFLPWWPSLLSPSWVFCWFPRFAPSLVFVVLKVSNLLSLPLLVVKLWIDLVLLTDLLLQWLVPDLWSTFLCGVVLILQTTIQEVQAFHRVKFLHFSGPKALEDFNLLRDYL